MGSDAPIPAIPGSHHQWKAVIGDPAYRRVLYVGGAEAPDFSVLPSGVEIWVGRQIFGERRDMPLSARGLRAHLQQPLERYEEEFEAWLMTEHTPALAQVPGVIHAARFAAVECAPMRCSLYFLEDSAVHRSKAWNDAIDTPWSTRMHGKGRQVSGLFQAVG